MGQKESAIMDNRLKAVLAGVLIASATTAEAASPQGLGPLFVDATLGEAVVEFIALGALFGTLGLAFKLIAAHVSEYRRVAFVQLASDSARGVVVALPATADATASEFDDIKRPEFAPVISLIEAQVQRQRANRLRDEQRANLNRA